MSKIEKMKEELRTIGCDFRIGGKHLLDDFFIIGSKEDDKDRDILKGWPYPVKAVILTLIIVFTAVCLSGLICFFTTCWIHYEKFVVAILLMGLLSFSVGCVQDGREINQQITSKENE